MYERRMLVSYFEKTGNKKEKRVLSVFNPLKVVIENYPDEKVEELEAINNPED